MSTTNLSPMNKQYLQKMAIKNNAYANNSTQQANITQTTNLDDSSAQDSFVNKNKKKTVIVSIVGIGSILAGLFLLAKKGKLGERAQNFVGNLFNNDTKLISIKDGKKIKLNSKGKTFVDASGKKASKLQLKDGIFLTEDGTTFNGTMSFTDKNGNQIQNIYKNGLITEIKENNILKRTYERSASSSTINERDKSGKLIKGITRTQYEDYTLIKTFIKDKGRYLIIPHDKSFIQINDTDAKRYITHHKIIDTKTKKVVQEGYLSFDTAALGKEGGVVIEDGNKKYIFHSKKLSEVYLPIMNLKHGTPPDVTPLNRPAIEETLPNGVIKYYNPHVKHSNISGFVFPGGERIECQDFMTGRFSIDYREKLNNHIGNITGEAYPKSKSEYLRSDAFPCIAPHHAGPSRTKGAKPFEDKDKNILFEFYKKFALNKEDQALVSIKESPEDLLYNSTLINEDTIKKSIDLGGWSGGIPQIEKLLEFMKKQGI